MTLIIILSLLTLPAAAATFCVGTAGELQQALQAAATNGEDDQVRIRSGTYPSPELQAFVYSTDDNFDLTVSGGWFDFNSLPCINRTNDPADTVLDGEGLRPVMAVNLQSNEGGTLTLHNLSIISALGDATGGGLRLYGPGGDFNGRVLIDRVRFSGNVGGTGPAIKVVGGNQVTVRNSIFVFNRSITARGVVNVSQGPADRGVYFINNTFMFNAHDLASTGSADASALFIDLAEDGQQGSSAFVTNNLFWSNNAPDLYTSLSGTVYLYNNNFDQRVGSVDFDIGNLNVEPLLVQPPIDLTPTPGSPMVDQGRPEPEPPIPFPTPFELDWSHGVQDFDGFGARVVGAGVDIGAIESNVVDALFRDRFEE